MDGTWHGDSQMGPEPGSENVEEATYEPEFTATSSQVRQLDFVLISFSLLVGAYVIFRDSHQDDGMFYFIVPVLLISLWVRL